MKNEKIYTPTLTELVFLPLSGIAIFALVNIDILYKRFLTSDELDISTGYFYSITDYLNNDVVNQGGLLLFWAVVGLLAYSMIGFLTFTYHAYRSELPTKDYTMFRKQPSDTNREHILRLFIRSASLATLAVFIVLNLLFGIRYLNTTFVEGAVELSILPILKVAALFGLDAFIGIFLTRLFLLKKRIFEN